MNVGLTEARLPVHPLHTLKSSRIYWSRILYGS